MASLAIVAAGAFPRKEYPRYVLRSADRVVCCDGALRTLLKAGFRADAVVGDFDSARQAELSRFTGAVVHNPDQETNDLTKAFRYAMQTWDDLTEIHILAATGKREDHTLGNISLLAQYRAELDPAIALDMISDYSTIIPLADSTTLYVGEGRPVSIFSLDPTLKIRSEGLQWSTDAVVFDSWWKATLNRACADSVTLTFSHPAPVAVVLA